MRTHPHTDYVWDFSRKVTTDGSNFPDVRLLDDSSLVTYEVGNYLPEEADPLPKPWISFGDKEFFMRGNDVFRRKSRQMDAALVAGSLADDALTFAIAEARHVGRACVRLPDAPKIELREGVMPADAISSKDAVTWGLCLKQECAADGSDLSYALFWGDILWAKPALGKHQQNAVNVLQQMDTLAFWLREAHANGMYNDALIQKEFEDDHQIIQKTLRSGQT